MSPGEAYERVLMICHVTSSSIISSLRTKKHNKAVGGEGHSLHLVGFAWDLEPDDDKDLQLIKYWGERLGLRVKLYKSSAHVQIDQI